MIYIDRSGIKYIFGNLTYTDVDKLYYHIIHGFSMWTIGEISYFDGPNSRAMMVFNIIFHKIEHEEDFITWCSDVLGQKVYGREER